MRGGPRESGREHVSDRPRLHREYLDLAAARLDEPLAPADEQRLEAHLATCDACPQRIAGYEADRVGLHALRQLPPPPRDLWARTSAALDREQARAATWRSVVRGPWATVRSALALIQN
jgi:anti-sigma factor RsiW